MDVHRARFIPYPLTTITALAFTRSHDKSTSSNLTLRLALARKDGSIEIWNPQNGDWVQETRFIIDNGVVPESLVWTQDPDHTSYDGQVIVGEYRLFSHSSDGRVVEWDIEQGIQKRQNTGNLAEIWCMTAQPRATNSTTSQDLVVGCGDGVLALLTTDEDDLQFKRYLARVSGKKARCLTIAYQSPDVLVAGFADGMIRVYDTKSGSIVRTMSIGASIPGASKSNLVWKLLCLPSGDIVSSDSNGELRIWDGKTLSMKQRVSGHDRDCLDLVASSNGETIFSCGVDGRIAAYRQTPGEKGRSSWAKTSHRKLTQEGGPVRALAAFDSKNMSVLVGASNDPSPILAPLRAFGKENTRLLPCLPQHAQLVSSPVARLVVTWWNDYVFIYKFAQHNAYEALRSEQKSIENLVARIKLRDSRVRTASISTTGDLLTVGTNVGVHLYQLAQISESSAALKIRKVRLPSEVADSGAKLSAFVDQDGNGTWLAVVNLKNEIMLTKMVWSQTRRGRYEAADMVIELDRAARKRNDLSGFKSYNATITQLLFSDDGAMLIAGDIGGNVDYWELHGDYDIDQKCLEVTTNDSKNGAREDDKDDSSVDDDDDDDDTETMLYGQTWRLGKALLPKLDSMPLVLTFRPNRIQNLIDSQLGDEALPAHRRLLVVTARHNIYEFDVREGQLSSWSKRNPSSSLPTELSKIRDRAMGAHWDPRERLWLYGSNFVFMLDVSDDLQTRTLQANKRKRGSADVASSKRSKGSGAGNVILNGHSTGEPHAAKKTVAGGKVSDVDLTVVSGLHDDDHDMDGNDDDIELALTTTKTKQKQNHSSLTPPQQQQQQQQLEQTAGESLMYWSTFKYRPILGVVALGHSYRVADESQDALEVVIVERPMPERIKHKSQR